MGRETSPADHWAGLLPEGRGSESPFPANDAEREALHIAQLVGLARQAVPSALGNAAIAVLVVLGLWGTLPGTAPLALWGTSVCSVSALRWRLMAPFRNPKGPQPSSAQVHQSLRFAFWGALATGALWGIAVAFLPPPHNAEVMTFVTLTTVAMASASLVSLSARPQVARAYILCTLVPLIARLLYEGERLQVFWAAMALIYILVLLRFGRGLQETFVSALSGRVRSQHLARELAEARGDLEAALDNVEQGIMMIDSTGLVRVCNRQAAELLGLSRELIETRPALSDVLEQEAQSGARSDDTIGRFVEIAGTHQPEHYEHKRSNGVLLDVRSVPIPGGGAVRTILDVTEARNRENALRAAEAEYRGLFENALVGAYRSSMDGRMLRANHALAQMLGYDGVSEFMGKLADQPLDIIYVEPARRAQFRDLLQAHGEVRDHLFEAYGRDRQRLWLSHNSRLVYGPDGRPLYLEGTVLDITQRRLAEDAIARANAAEESSRIKSHFLANISHELRTPLNAVIGFADLIEKEAHGPLGAPEYRDYAGEIQKSGDRLLSIVNEILDLTKLEAGDMDLLLEELEPVDLAESCQGSADRMAKLAGITLEANLAPVPLVRVDHKRLRQVLLHLLSNAVKFTPAGGTVTLSTTTDAHSGGAPSRIAFVVTDTGIGMAAEEIAVALQPFRQVDSSRARRREGTGLGLSVARRLTELHGGSLEIHSMPGRGTIATVWLPVADRVETAVAA